MKKWMLSLPLCLALCGCGMLLERSYSSVEPYANRYWDSGAEDTLRSETYQDLVNSLLLLVEERAEEGTRGLVGRRHGQKSRQRKVRVGGDTGLKFVVHF